MDGSRKTIASIDTLNADAILASKAADGIDSARSILNILMGYVPQRAASQRRERAPRSLRTFAPIRPLTNSSDMGVDMPTR